MIDPTAVNHQGEDFGVQYRTGIYYVDQADEAVARACLDALAFHTLSPQGLCDRLIRSLWRVPPAAAPSPTASSALPQTRKIDAKSCPVRGHGCAREIRREEKQ